jgi:AcrR family transcriptional regulator
MDVELNDRIRKVVSRIAPTQREAAQVIGLDPTKLSKSLNGVRRFSTDELVRMAGAGGVSVDWLVHGHGQGPLDRKPVPAESFDEVSDDERRRRFLEEAWRLIAEKGYHAVRISDIAAACGTSSGAVHYYFPGKQEILEDAMRHCVEQTFKRQYAALRDVEDARERLERLIDNQVPAGGSIANEWSVWLQFWCESALRPELRPIHNDFYARWRETVIRIIRRGERQGVFRDVDAEEVALRFTSLTDGLGIQVMTGMPGVTPQRMRAILFDFMRHELLVDSDGRVA